MGKALRPQQIKQRKVKYINKAKKSSHNNKIDELNDDPVKRLACSSKKRFHGTKDVIQAGRGVIRRFDKDKMFYYLCPHCDGYHLTHIGTYATSIEIKLKEV